MVEDKNREKNIVSEFKNKIEASIKNFNDDSFVFHKGLLDGYLENEIEEIQSSSYISTTGLFPKIFKNISENLTAYNNSSNKKITLEVDVVSTMLPIHYWNFPITVKALIPKKIKNNGRIIPTQNLKTVKLNCKREFTDQYRDWLENYGNDKNEDIRIRRTTLISDKPNFLKNIKHLNYKRIAESDFYDIVELEKNLNYHIDTTEIRKIENERGNNIQYSLGLDDEMLDIFNEIKSGAVFELEDLETYYIQKEKDEKNKNVFDYFIDKLHSKSASGKPEAFFCFFTNTNNGEKIPKIEINNKPINPISINDLPDITPDFLIFSFRCVETDEILYEAILVGKVDLIEGYVKLNYYNKKSDKKNETQMFNDYKDAHKIILENSYDSNFDEKRLNINEKNKYSEESKNNERIQKLTKKRAE